MSTEIDKKIEELIEKKIKEKGRDISWVENNPMAITAYLNNISNGPDLGVAIPSHDLYDIFIRHLYPAFRVTDGRFSPSESKYWKDKFTAKQKGNIEKAAASVGHVMATDHPQLTYIGTAWKIAENIIVTNRHVAKELSIQDIDGKLKIDEHIGAKFDFSDEAVDPSQAKFNIVNVFNTEPANGVGVSFLKIALSEPEELDLATDTDDLPDKVVAIGYPGRDRGAGGDSSIRDHIFGEEYNIKRVSPSEKLEIENGKLEHSCTTLGGSSGSPILDINTGRVVGLHVSGKDGEPNEGVPYQKIREYFENLPF